MILALRTLYFEDLSLGMTERLSKTIASSDVVGFAQVTGDRNPIHLSEHFAATPGLSVSRWWLLTLTRASPRRGDPCAHARRACLDATHARRHRHCGRSVATGVQAGAATSRHAELERVLPRPQRRRRHRSGQ